MATKLPPLNERPWRCIHCLAPGKFLEPIENGWFCRCCARLMAHIKP